MNVGNMLNTCEVERKIKVFLVAYGYIKNYWSAFKFLIHVYKITLNKKKIYSL